MIALLVALLGAFWNRARGGIFSVIFNLEGEDVGKYDWIGRYGNALLFGGLYYYVTSAWLAGLAGFGGMMLGASFGWGKYVGGIVQGFYDQNEEEIKWIDNLVMSVYNYPTRRSIAALSLRGLIWSFSIVAVLYGFDIAHYYIQGDFTYLDLSLLYFVPVGLTMGIVYYLASRVGRLFGEDAKGQWKLGEYAFGFVLWGAFYLIAI